MRNCVLLCVGLAVCGSVVADRDMDIDVISSAAKAGDALAQFISARGMIEHVVEDSPEFWDQALSLLREAADQGLAVAQGLLGALHDDGLGPIEQDFAEGARWHRRAAEQGLIVAQTVLADRHLAGNGVTKDRAEAFYWRRQAAEQGDFESQIMLVAHYYRGDGVPKDETMSYAWVAVAAATDPHAEKNGQRIAALRDSWAESLSSAQLAEGTHLAHGIWSRIRTPRHYFMLQTPFPTGEARELRARVLEAIGVDAEMPEPAEER